MNYLRVNKTDLFKTLNIINERISKIYNNCGYEFDDKTYFELSKLREERMYIEQFINQIYAVKSKGNVVFDLDFVNEIIDTHLNTEQNFVGSDKQNYDNMEKVFEERNENYQKILLRRIEKILEYVKTSGDDPNVILINYIRNLARPSQVIDDNYSFLERKYFDDTEEK